MIQVIAALSKPTILGKGTVVSILVKVGTDQVLPTVQLLTWGRKSRSLPWTMVPKISIFIARWYCCCPSLYITATYCTILARHTTFQKNDFSEHAHEIAKTQLVDQSLCITRRREFNLGTDCSDFGFGPKLLIDHTCNQNETEIPPISTQIGTLGTKVCTSVW